MTRISEGDIVRFKKPGYTYNNKEGQVIRIDEEIVRSRGELIGHKSSRKTKAKVRRLDTGDIEEVSTKDLEFLRGTASMERMK